MKALLSVLLMLLGVELAIAQPDVDGLLMNDESYLQLPRKAPVMIRRGLLNLPQAVSYEAYCPKPFDQGPQGTCMAIVLGYYIRTIMEARRLGLTDVARINEQAFSPSYIYQEAKKPEDYACTYGLDIRDAVRVIEQRGIVPLRLMGYPACGQSTASLKAQAQPYRIAEAQQILDLNLSVDERVSRIKMALTEGAPIMVSFFATSGFKKFKGSVWAPEVADQRELQQRLKLYEQSQKTGRAHALCILGYDNNKYGGAFRVVNSVGTNWGESGFCWIRYADLGAFTRYALQLYPRLAGSGNQSMKGQTIELTLERDNGQPMPARYDAASSQTAGMPVYRLTQSYNSNTSFKVRISNSQQTYLYIYGTDEQSKSRLAKLYPYVETHDGHTAEFSALLGPGTSVAYPPDNTIQMDDKPGTDYLMLLFVSHELQPGQIENRLNTVSGTTLLHRFGQLLAPGSVISHDAAPEQINVSVKPGNAGLALPVLVLIEHR